MRDERGVDAGMGAERLAVVVLDRVGCEEVDGGEEADSGRRLAAVLHSGEAGDVVTLELRLRLARRSQDRHRDENSEHCFAVPHRSS
jgi:hypothetical protein